jgi:hypothetical protein
MPFALNLTRVEFHAEDHPDVAVVPETLATFVEDQKQTAHEKLAAFVRALPPVKLYVGWDGNIYPQLWVERVERA